MSDSIEELVEQNLANTDPSTIKDDLRRALNGEEKPKPREFKSVEVERSGNKIILPEGMSYDNAMTWLDMMQEAEETEVGIRAAITCYPLDGAYALSKALEEIYGFTQLKSTPGFFSSTPPTLINVPTGPKTSEQVPWGRMELPGIEGYIETHMDIQKSPVLLITGQVKRKHEAAVKLIVAKTKKYVKEQSIYKGKALRVNLEYMSNPKKFHPEGSAPQFMDTRGLSEDTIILNESSEFDIKSSIWNRIKRPKYMLDNNIPLKHGALLMGPYGTGKTLTASVTAAIAEQNGWTFIYLEDTTQLAHALRFAELYAPAVLFSEDVDKAIEGEDRTVEINDILNTIDGVDTKDKPIITVLTTNHPENINKAFLRAGRIDSVISMEAPNSSSAEKFVSLFAGDHLAKDVNLSEIGKALEGIVPAFIEEAVNKARLYATARAPKDDISLKGKLTTSDILKAAQSQKKHIAMVESGEPESEAETTLHHLRQGVFELFQEKDD